MRDPRRKVRELARELGPSEVAAIVVQELIGRGIGRMLRRGSEAVRRRFADEAEEGPPPRSAEEAAEAEARRQRELDELSYDPHRGRVDERTLREAEVGLALRDRGALPAPIRRPDRGRGESGDIVDGNEQQWDVKSFQSREALEQGIRAKERAKGLPEPQLGPHIRGEFDLEEAMANVERSH